jgi:hypothetical protein
MPDNQLEVEVAGIVAPRFIADDSLAISQIHRVGLERTFNLGNQTK